MLTIQMSHSNFNLGRRRFRGSGARIEGELRRERRRRHVPRRQSARAQEQRHPTDRRARIPGLQSVQVNGLGCEKFPSTSKPCEGLQVGP